MVARRDEVFARYQPLFASRGVANLTGEESRSFLSIENNNHWTGLFRLDGKACEDTDALRPKLARLFDDSRPIEKCFDRLSRQLDPIPPASRQERRSSHLRSQQSAAPSRL